MMLGVVAYSNEAKQNLLGVPAELIEEYGAVSEEVARAMAEGVRRLAGTDVGLSLTGIMGPTGGTEEKPVGLVYLAAVGSIGYARCTPSATRGIESPTSAERHRKR